MRMRLDHLTFTRFIAALSVVIFHYGSTTTPFDIAPFSHVFQAGPIAVSYFYSLSGFIMAIAYYRPDKPDFNKRKYWLARFARIYPVYLLALLLVFAANYKDLEDGSSALLLNLSLLQAWIPGYPLSLNSPGWSLSVEAFFYLCLPFLILYAYRAGIKKLVWFSVILWLGTQILHTALLNSSAYEPHNHLHDFIYYNPLMHINTFLIGLVGGIFFKKNYHYLQSQQAPNQLLLLSSFVLICLLIIIQATFEENYGFNIDLTNGLIAPLSLVFIIALSCDTGRLSRWFSLPIFVLLGEASYSLYILQRPVHGLYEKLIATPLGIPDYLDFYAYLTVLILVSILSYRWFETPARQLINRCYKR